MPLLRSENAPKTASSAILQDTLCNQHESRGAGTKERDIELTGRVLWPPQKAPSGPSTPKSPKSNPIFDRLFSWSSQLARRAPVLRAGTLLEPSGCHVDGRRPEPAGLPRCLRTIRAEI